MWGIANSVYGGCALQFDEHDTVEKLYFSTDVHFDGLRDDRRAEALAAKIFADANTNSDNNSNSDNNTNSDNNSDANSDNNDSRRDQQRVKISLRGSELQMAVWTELQQIPRGQTRTYTEIAAAIGRHRAVRAVATAIGQNEIAYLVACHRVIRTDGTLGGYRWGLPIKQQILTDELTK